MPTDLEISNLSDSKLRRFTNDCTEIQNEENAINSFAAIC